MTNKVTRLSVNLNTETAGALKDMAGAKNLTYTETVRRAISVYKFLLDESTAGREIRVQDKDGQNPREVLFL